MSVNLAIQKISKKILREVIKKSLEINFQEIILNEAIQKDKISKIIDKRHLLSEYNPTKVDINEPNNRNLFKTLKKAKENPELRRAILNDLENGSELKGSMGEYMASKNLEKCGKFEREVVNGKNKVDFACKEGLNKNVSFRIIDISDNGKHIVNKEMYLKNGEKLAVEVKNGMSEINSRKHLKEQLEAGKNLCGKSYLAINQDMAKEIINNPDKYIKIIDDIKSKADGIIVMMPNIKSQIYVATNMDIRM